VIYVCKYNNTFAIFVVTPLLNCFFEPTSNTRGMGFPDGFNSCVKISITPSVTHANLAQDYHLQSINRHKSRFPFTFPRYGGADRLKERYEHARRTRTS